VIEPTRSWVPHFVRETRGYRDLFVSLVRRDVALRYKQTAIGPAWVILQPILTAATFAFLFGSVAKVPLDVDVSYFVFALVGMSLWTGFAASLTRGTTSLIANRDLVSKVYFPRVLLPAAAAAAASLDCFAILTGVVIYLAVFGPGLGIEALLVLPLAVSAIGFAAALASGMGALLVGFRDVAYGLPLIVQSLLLVTPVLYPLSSVDGVARDLMQLNPMTTVFEALRWALLDGSAPGFEWVLYAAAVMGLVGFAATAVFARLERTFADVI
jgi:lipopolysaccharide transport system permease protein